MTDTVKRKELIKQVAARSQYNLYEVEDVLMALEYVIKENLLLQRNIKIGELFTLNYKLYPSRRFHNPLKGEIGMTKPKVGLEVKLTAYMDRVLNNQE